MVKDDRKIATFHSPFRGGDVGLWYCAHRNVYELSVSNDYDYVETGRCLSKKGRPCRKYVISIDNGD